MASARPPHGRGEELEIVRVRRRQERSALTRQKILDAATKEFATAGFGGATTRSIAERAQVQHGLVIYHFQTKLGVWQAVMARVVDGLHQAIVAALENAEDADDVTKLRTLLRDKVRVMARTPEVTLLMSREAANESGRMNWLLEQLVGEDVEVTVDLIRKAQAAGQFVEGDPVHLHYLYLGAAAAVFTLPSGLEKAMGRFPFDDAFVDKHIEACEHLFFRSAPGDLSAAAAEVRSAG